MVVESYLLFFVLFIYFPTIWWSRGGTSCAGGTSKLYLTIVLAQVTITAPRFLLQKKGRLRLIWRRRPFDQYADQYQKISGWTQWTRQWFVPVETGAKSAGKHPISVSVIASFSCYYSSCSYTSPPSVGVGPVQGKPPERSPWLVRRVGFPRTHLSHSLSWYNRNCGAVWRIRLRRNFSCTKFWRHLYGRKNGHIHWLYPS